MVAIAETVDDAAPEAPEFCGDGEVLTPLEVVKNSLRVAAQADAAAECYKLRDPERAAHFKRAAAAIRADVADIVSNAAEAQAAS